MILFDGVLKFDAVGHDWRYATGVQHLSRNEGSEMQSRKILVVDDEVMVAEVSQITLSSLGHQVQCSPSGEHAVDLTMKDRYDLAIIDAMLPGMDGFETFAALQQNCSRIKGVLVSGDLTPEMIFAAREQGFCATLSKPLQPEELEQALRGAFPESSVEEENLRLRNQLREATALLGQYMAPEVASMLLNRQTPVTDRPGEVCELTILFADIRHFTFLVEHLPLQQCQIFLTEFFDLVADVIAERQGTLDKFIGDAALAVFGAPVALEQPSLAAVLAALDIQKGFEVLRARWARHSEYFEQIGLGIGVSRGTVYLGNVGSRRRLDYTVIGADVNIAQRLASETVAGQILVTEAVQNEIGGSIVLQEEKNRLLRGMENQIRLYSILP